MATTATAATARELDSARKVLNCLHRFPTNPPFGSIAQPGNCRDCNVSPDRAEPVAYWMRQPLSDLLRNAASIAGSGNHAGSETHLGKAVAVARAITGSAR